MVAKSHKEPLEGETKEFTCSRSCLHAHSPPPATLSPLHPLHLCIPLLSLPDMWGHSKKVAVYKPGTGPSPEPDHADILTSDFQSPELWETNVYWLSHPEYCIFLQQLKLRQYSNLLKVWTFPPKYVNLQSLESDWEGEFFSISGLNFSRFNLIRAHTKMEILTWQKNASYFIPIKRTFSFFKEP